MSFLPNVALADVTNMERWIYDLTTPTHGDNVQNNQGNAQADEMEREMEEGDAQQQAPSENVVSTSMRTRRRRERVSASNDDIMVAINQ